MAHLLAETYPYVFHVAYGDAWSSLIRHGLLCTSALLDLFEVEASARPAIERQRRPSSVIISHPVHGTARIRDQAPLIEKRLATALVGMTPGEWYELLNGHVFLWPTKDRMLRMLQAAAYRNERQLVVTLDTAALIDVYKPAILLSRLNSGATRPFAWPRGAHTFQTLPEYPLAERVRSVGKASAVAEVLVKAGIVPLTGVAVSAVVWCCAKPVKTVWTAPQGAGSAPATSRSPP